MSVMTAKFSGRCTTCREAFPAGTRINYRGRGRTSHVQCPQDNDEPTTARDDGLRWSGRGQSGNGGYVTSSGRCEDAPCCGCCGTSSSYYDDMSYAERGYDDGY